MSRRIHAFLVLASLALGVGGAFAGAPSAREYMQPVDTTAGSISDPKKLFKVDLNQIARVSVSAMPLEVAFNQVNATTGIEFGYGDGIKPTTTVTLSTTGKGRDVLKALGRAVGMRFEANGPNHLRVVRAREKAPLRTTPPRNKDPK